MLVPAFQLHLSEKIQRAQAAVGRYDGKLPALACATTAGKVFLHQPHQHQGMVDNQVAYLNINKNITALVSGRLAVGSQKDILLIGSPSSLQAYDVEANRDLFFKDVPDGVSVCIVGQFGLIDVPLAIVGGNCSVHGFAHGGEEQYWTVTGDHVTALALCDIDQDGRAELLVGSNDFDIRMFQGEDVIAETSEADQFVGLCSVYGTKFGYGLVNGTIGVYDKLDRVWRVKSKHSVSSVCSYDLDGDGVPELVSGWSNGRMEVRRADSGEVVYRDHLTCPVAAVFRADYRNDGVEQVVVCGTEGEVRGYLPADFQHVPEQMVEADFAEQQATIADLAQRKQELMYELSSYVNARSSAADRETVDRRNVIPVDTRVDSFIAINREASSCDLVLRTNNDTIIRGVVVFGEQIFEEESLSVFPKDPGSSLSVSVKPVKDVAVVLMIKVLVGYRLSTVFHVFELEIELPRFAMYAAVDRSQIKEPASSVTFPVSERLVRLATWCEVRFNTKPAARGDALEACFLSLRDKQPLIIRASPAQAGGLQVSVLTDRLDVAGEVVQDLAAYLGIVDLASVADFPVAMQAFRAVLMQVEEHNTTRLRINADMADSALLVKQLLVKAEDARLLGDMRAMRRFYRMLHDLNRDLIAEHDKRATNHQALVDALKEVNQMIQRAARLRAGVPKTRLVAACRAAIKDNQMLALIKLMRDG